MLDEIGMNLILIFAHLKLTAVSKRWKFGNLTFILPRLELFLSLFLVLPKNTDKNHNV